MSLLLPAVQMARASARATQCANRQHQIGVAFHHYIQQKGRTPTVDIVLTGLGPYMTEQSGSEVYRCPEVPVSETVSYGVNECVHRLVDESTKIVLLDAVESTVRFSPGADTDWATVVDPRHSGGMNVLYFDGSVERKWPDDINPQTDPNMLASVWKPRRGCDTSGGCSCSGPGSVCGLWSGWNNRTGNYGPSWEAFRLQPTLQYPWGSGNAVEAAIEGISVPESKPPGIGNRHTVMLTGWIMADHSETYEFFVQYDDATTITIDGHTIFRRPGHVWSNRRVPADRPLAMTACQWVEIVIVNENFGGTSELRLWWRSPSTPLEDVPDSNIRTTAP